MKFDDLTARRFLTDLFEAAVARAQPDRCVPAALPAPPRGRVVVLGAGKASAAMARAVEKHWPDPGRLEGVVVTRYGHGVPCRHIEIVEAAHPVPDGAGQEAARRILELAQGLGPDDLALCLISGGGSALLSLPGPGLTLADKQATAKALLRSGATIHEMNAVRKHLSAIKGGRLAAAIAPARAVTLLISDVPGDDPAVIASGPTVPDPSSRGDALLVLERYGLAGEGGVPKAVMAALRRPESETPKPGDAIFADSAVTLVATPQQSLEAAAEAARRWGVTPHILSDRMEGEARDIALAHAAIADQIARLGQPFAKPCVLLSGGETTVTVRSQGRGGRNTEFLLALALALNGAPGLHAIACDTDGIDGTEDNAGALVSPDTLTRLTGRGLSAAKLLAANDAYRAFSTLGDLVSPGPTFTNVNDFRAILVAS